MRSHARLSTPRPGSSGSRVLFAVAALLSLLIFTSQASAGTVTTHPFLFSFNGASAPEGPLVNPSGIAIGETDHSVYVVEFEGRTVRKFDTAGNPADFSSLGTSVLSGANTPLGAFEKPTAIAVDNTGGPQDGTIYIGDGERGVVIAFDSEGNFLYEFSGSDIPYVGYGRFARINALAVDPNGDLRIADIRADTGDPKGGVPGNTRIYKYKPTGSGASYVSDIRFDETEGSLDRTQALAIDSGGSIYASVEASRFSPGGRYQVKRLSPSGIFQSLVGTEPSELLGPQVAVDPSTDHLYTADQFTTGGVSNNSPAIEFDSSGTLISRFAPTNIKGTPGGLAVDGSSGHIYLSDLHCGACSEDVPHDIKVYGPLESVTVPDATAEPASDLSFFEATLHGTVNPQVVPTSYRFEYRQQGAVTWNKKPTPTEAIEPTDGADHAVSAVLQGIQHNTTYEYRLAAVNTDADAQSISDVLSFTTPRVPPPLVSIASPSQLTASSAELSGTVNPRERATKWRFEYSTDQLNWNRVPGPDGNSETDDAADSGNSEVPVAAELSNLSPDTHYFLRLVATNDLEDKATAAIEFTTESSAPLILTAPAAVATSAGATLNATLIPGAPGTTYRFEYGTDTGYGTTVPDGDAGSGGEPVTVSSEITGLSADTTYHFRLIAANSEGTNTGPDRTFHTLENTPAPGLPDGRVYEKVSPSEKGGVSVERVNGQSLSLAGRLGQVSASGDAVAWTSKGNFGGDAGALYLTYITRRTGAGWSSTIGLTPRGDRNTAYQWFSDDLSRGIVPAFPLHSGDPRPEGEEVKLLYLRDTTSSNDDANSTYQLLSKPTIPLHLESGGQSLISPGGASSDLSHIALDSYLQLTADGHIQAGTNAGVYELVNGELRFVSVLPSETPAAKAGLGNGKLLRDDSPGLNPISEDGSRIFFTATSSESHPTSSESHLFVRENGTTTRGVSCFQNDPSPDCEADRGEFEAAKASDGSIAFFTSRAGLTADAGSDTSNDLYRWDANAPAGSKLTDLTTADPVVSNGVLGTAAISRDATKVYFVADLNLAPGGERGVPNLYLWQQGVGIRHLATLVPVGDGSRSSPDDATWEDTRRYERPRVTPDGEHLLFTSHAQLTPYDTDGHQQVYLYDLGEDQISCLSCNRRAGASSDDSYLSIAPVLAQIPGSGGQAPLQNLSTDGSRVFFDTKGALLANDTNGKADVYEWSGGKLHLISTGAGATDSTFMGASKDGDDAFFISGEQLVRSDQDELLDIYDARVNGVREPNPEVPCVGDECQGTPLVPQSFHDPATAVSGAATGNVSAEKQRHKRKKHHKKAQHKKQNHKTGRQGR